MEFEFNCEDLFNLDPLNCVILRGQELKGYCGYNSYNHTVRFEQGKKHFRKDNLSPLDKICSIVDRLGCGSATAQGLPQPITSMAKFAGTDQRIYIRVVQNRVEGMLKVGPKNLFYRDKAGRCKELTPICVLDFYVNEKLQRRGLGRVLFEKMLDNEKTTAAKIAYDRPSPKLLQFLQKHFCLSQFTPQNNNFVIFDSFFCSPGSQSVCTPSPFHHLYPEHALAEPMRAPCPQPAPPNYRFMEGGERDRERHTHTQAPYCDSKTNWRDKQHNEQLLSLQKKMQRTDDELEKARREMTQLEEKLGNNPYSHQKNGALKTHLSPMLRDYTYQPSSQQYGRQRPF